jgi:hypothetical protein
MKRIGVSQREYDLPKVRPRPNHNRISLSKSKAQVFLRSLYVEALQGRGLNSLSHIESLVVEGVSFVTFIRYQPALIT